MQTHLQAPTSSWNTSHILRTDPGAATCSKAHGCCMRAPFVERGRRQDGGCFWPPLSHSGQNLLASFLMSSSVSLSALCLSQCLCKQLKGAVHFISTGHHNILNTPASNYVGASQYTQRSGTDYRSGVQNPSGTTKLGT